RRRVTSGGTGTSSSDCAVRMKCNNLSLITCHMSLLTLWVINMRNKQPWKWFPNPKQFLG
ncbi:MAG: hypothetical protein ACKOOA_03190, partial [Sediminibacterium sp.]